MIRIRCFVLAAFSCGLLALGASEGGDKAASGDSPPIKAVVAYFAKNGIKLDSGDRGWVVVDPKEDGYQVVVYLRTFPAAATEQDMQNELKMHNLAYMLNVSSRLAMSYPGLRGTDSAKQLPKLNEVPVAAKLQKLFTAYRPAEPTK